MASGNSINQNSAGITGFTGTAFTGTAVTNHAVIVGGATSSTLTNVGPSATAGQVLQSGGASADPSYSTATYPATATGTGTILRADGTNWSATTATYPTTTTANQLLYSSATNTIGGLTSANNSIVLTDGSGVPSLGTSLSNDFTFTKATSGATTTLTVSNTSNTASSKSLIQSTVAGGTADDALHTFTVTGGNSASIGIDNSDSDRFKLSYSTTLGTTDTIIADATGGQYKGYNTNTAPAAGFLGERITSAATTASFSDNVAKDVTSITLTAGVWDITASASSQGSAFTSGHLQLGIGTTSATFAGSVGDQQNDANSSSFVWKTMSVTVPAYRVTISGSTTYYLVALVQFTSGTMSVAGRISGVRVG